MTDQGVDGRRLLTKIRKAVARYERKGYDIDAIWVSDAGRDALWRLVRDGGTGCRLRVGIDGSPDEFLDGLALLVPATPFDRAPLASDYVAIRVYS